MKKKKLLTVEKSCAPLRIAANYVDISPRNLRTLADLVNTIPENASYFKMLRTSAGHIASFLNLPITEVLIDSLFRLGHDFKLYLGQRLKPASVNSYCHFVSMLRKRAEDLGWRSQEPDVSTAWHPLLAAVKKIKPDCTVVIRDAIRNGKTPGEFCDDDLDMWARATLAQGRGHEYVRRQKRNFRRVILKSGLSEALPRLTHPTRKLRYGIPPSSFPEPLRAQVAELRRWKTAKHVVGRPTKFKIVERTAQSLENFISRLYGFYISEFPSPAVRVSSLPELITHEIVGAFVSWAVDTRKILGQSLVTDLRSLHAAMKQYYKDLDFTWFFGLVNEVTLEDESELEERKKRKLLPYEVLSDVPRRIREARKRIAKENRKAMAARVRDELLILWLVTLPWRQRNIRECRLGADIEGSNLYRGPLSEMDVAMPVWVGERIKLRPDEEFWQIRFTEKETKKRHKFRAVLPRPLIPLLEEYLTYHRPILLNGRQDSGMLFLKRNGTPFDLTSLTNLVGDLTLKFAHKRVTPHMFRDAFAYKWLRDNPKDYLTLSKILWHRNIQTTIDRYGKQYNESQGIVAIDEWLESRNARAEAAPHQPKKVANLEELKTLILEALIEHPDWAATIAEYASGISKNNLPAQAQCLPQVRQGAKVA